MDSMVNNLFFDSFLLGKPYFYFFSTLSSSCAFSAKKYNPIISDGTNLKTFVLSIAMTIVVIFC